MDDIKQKYPLFSIITVTLDNFSGFSKTHESITKQGFDEFEWIVIDGQSKDETVDLLRKIRSKTRTSPYPFQFVSQKDDGIYDAMNTGIEMAKGKYLIFMNAGDILATQNTLSQIAKHTENKPDFIYGDSLEAPKNSRKPVTKTARSHEDIIWGMFTHHQAMIYRRSIIRDTKLRYSLIHKIAADYDFTARFLNKAKKIVYINKPICVFKLGGFSQQNANKGRKEQYKIRETLEMTSQPKNLWILTIQALSWHLNAKAPWLYKIVKPIALKLADKFKNKTE